MKKKAIIFGAGAIGRGFLGPLLSKLNFELSFVDKNLNLIKKMKSVQSYKAAITNEKKYDIVDVPIRNIYSLEESIDIKSYDFVFCCVGPKQCYEIAKRFENAKTVISCENDISTVDGLKKLSKNSNIFFGIPDVITSNTASKQLLEKDELITVTEKGNLIVEKGNFSLPKSILQTNIKQLEIHWKCKLFIHNAPHAILSYLGALKKYTYIHEAMSDKSIEKIVLGSINEITEGVIRAGYVPKGFAEKYKNKEIKRFKNKLLFDPITRVAREPLRKLSKDNRIILALRVAQFNKKLPQCTALGVRAALNYYNKNDSESIYLQNIRKSLSDTEILKKFSGIEENDPLSAFCLKQDLSRFNKR